MPDYNGINTRVKKASNAIKIVAYYHDLVIIKVIIILYYLYHKNYN